MPLAPYRVKVENPKINILLYGPQGIGKTTLATSAQEHPEMSPVLVINFEGGLLSIGSRGDIDAVDIKQITEMDELFWLLRNRTPPYDQYKTVVIDSGSEMQSLALEETTRREIEEWKKKNGGREPDRTIDDLEIRTYGTVNAQLSRLFRWYRDLPINTIITALPKLTYSQGANQKMSTPILVEPMFTAKLATQVMGYMDMVWYMGENVGRKYILTRDQGPYRAKTRGYNFLNALGPIHSDPWLPPIYELLLSSEKSNAHATQTINETPLTAAQVFAEEPAVPTEPEQEVAD